MHASAETIHGGERAGIPILAIERVSQTVAQKLRNKDERPTTSEFGVAGESEM